MEGSWAGSVAFERKKEWAIWTGPLETVSANPGLIIWRGTVVGRMTLSPWGDLRRFCKKKHLYDCHGKKRRMGPKIENLAEFISTGRQCSLFWGFFSTQYQRRPPCDIFFFFYYFACIYILFPLPIILNATEYSSQKKGDSAAWFHHESIYPKIDGQSIA